MNFAPLLTALVLVRSLVAHGGILAQDPAAALRSAEATARQSFAIAEKKIESARGKAQWERELLAQHRQELADEQEKLDRLMREKPSLLGRHNIATARDRIAALKRSIQDLERDLRESVASEEQSRREAKALFARLTALQNERRQLESEAATAVQQAAEESRRDAIAELQMRAEEEMRQYRDQVRKQQREDADRDREEERIAQLKADAAEATEEVRKREREQRAERRRAEQEARERAAEKRRQEWIVRREAEEERLREQFEAEERARAAALLAAKLAEAERLRDLVDSGIALVNGNDGDSSGRQSNGGTASQVLGVRKAASDLYAASVRLLAGDRPELSERAQLIRENAGDLLKLGDRATDALLSAATALASGDDAAATRVLRELEVTANDFVSRADDRAKRASPEVDLLRSGQELADAVDQSSRSTDRTASGGRRTVSANSNPPAGGVGPISPIIAEAEARVRTMFVGGVYALEANKQPITLYRVKVTSAGRSEIYWSTAKPSSAGPDNVTVMLTLPANAELYRGRPIGAAGELIYLEHVDPAWIVK